MFNSLLYDLKVRNVSKKKKYRNEKLRTGKVDKNVYRNLKKKLKEAY